MGVDDLVTDNEIHAGPFHHRSVAGATRPALRPPITLTPPDGTAPPPAARPGLGGGASTPGELSFASLPVRVPGRAALGAWGATARPGCGRATPRAARGAAPAVGL